MKPKRVQGSFAFFYKERKRTQRALRSFTKNVKNAKNATFFYKERKWMQRTKHSFIKEAKESKNVAFFWKERLPNPAKLAHFLRHFHVDFVLYTKAVCNLKFSGVFKSVFFRFDPPLPFPYGSNFIKFPMKWPNTWPQASPSCENWSPYSQPKQIFTIVRDFVTALNNEPPRFINQILALVDKACLCKYDFYIS